MRVLTILIILAVGATVFSSETIKNPIEVGDVRWGRDLDAALEYSAKSGKPVLVLFQEIPGCSGVQRRAQFGHSPIRFIRFKKTTS